MRARITRIAISFAAVLSAYVVYALIIVRMIEPSVSAAPKTAHSDQELKSARNLANQAAMQLHSYFPEGAWERKNPKVLGNDRVKLLVSDYTNLPDGGMQLTKCTMLFFEEPSPNKPKAPPVILQAPEGAILKFDEEFDLKRAKIGRLVGGQLNGQVTIRRQPSRPGAGDDVLIVTKNVRLVEDRVVTTELVNFRFGASYGSGRDMTILLVRDDPTGKPGKNAAINGVRSLTLAREVTVHMISTPDDNPATTAGVAAPADAKARAAKEQPPVKVTCQGPFCFDLDKSVATFNEKVDVFRLNATGPSDEMNCEMLAIHFERRDDAAGSLRPKNAPRNSASGAAALEARWIEARGDPVIIRAPSQGAQVRGQRVEYDMKTGRIVVDGPGTLQGAPARNPSGRYLALWSRQLLVEPLVGEQMVTLLGGAKVSMADMAPRSADGAPQSGTLWADEIRTWLTSPSSSGAPPTTAQAAAPRGGPVQHTTIRKPGVVLTAAPNEPEVTRPKRILAQGAVRVESPQLIGATGQLDAIFVPTPPLAAGEADAPAAAGTSKPAAAGPGQRTARAEQQFRVASSKMEIHLAVRGPQTVVSELFLDGKALLVEAKTAKPEDKPLVVTGDRLEVFRADVPDTKIVVIGKPGKVEARGLALAGPEIQLQRATNLLWIDGPGRMTGPAPADQTLAAGPMPAARPAAKPSDAGNLDVTWTGRMQFDGHTAHFERTVVARTATWQVHADMLDAALQRTIDFAHPPDPNAKAEPAALEQLVCTGGPRGLVEFENRSTDETGLASIDRLEAPDLALNRTTGGIDAHGPGWVSSVRRGGAAAARMRSPGGPQPKAKPVADKKPPAHDPNALSYLAVHFARSISGNMYQRELTFTNQVKCIYGPVVAWESKLDVENPDQAGPDAINLTTDALTVREAPGRLAGEPGWLELETEGNTQADGMGITARAHRLTFAEQKSLMVLEGDGVSNASVFRQTTPGAPISTTTASRILFWPSTSRVEVDNGRFIDLGAMPSPARRDDKSKTK
ncbi:MAG TPA: hypothetical protein VHY91_27370 [Pirellulales bacterium]|nr:hypothetical protein [Pirellulales bacterium]